MLVMGSNLPSAGSPGNRASTERAGGPAPPPGVVTDCDYGLFAAADRRLADE